MGGGAFITGAPPVFEGGVGWRWWLWAAASSEDCWLASHATKALLNLEAVLEGEQGFSSSSVDSESSSSSSSWEMGGGRSAQLDKADTISDRQQQQQQQQGQGTVQSQGEGGLLEGFVGGGWGAWVGSRKKDMGESESESGSGSEGKSEGGCKGQGEKDGARRQERQGQQGKGEVAAPCATPVWGDMVHLLNPHAAHHRTQSDAVVPRRCVWAWVWVWVWVWVCV